MTDESQEANLLLHDSTRRTLNALAHPVTLEILLTLADAESDVTNLAGRLELDTSFISRHLRRLHALGLVRCAIRAKRHVYSLTSTVVKEAAGEHAVLAISTPHGDYFRLKCARQGPPGTSGQRMAEPSSSIEGKQHRVADPMG